MGIYITLNVIPDLVDAKLWESTYEESLQLLRAYPYPLMSFTHENLGFATRLIHSEKLEYTKKNGTKYWKVVGDLKTGEYAEEFSIEKDINDCFPSRKEREFKENIDILSQEADSPLVKTALYAKTQGFQYHNAILAVAALFESRMPLHAHARGDITRYQAEEAIQWANEVLSEKIETPICLDAPRLFARLKGLISGEDFIERFSRLFMGSRKERYGLLWKDEPELVKNWFVKKSHEYKPGTIGCMNMLVDWLNATGDLRTLIEIFCVREDGARFSPEDIADTLASLGFTVPLEEIEELHVLSLSEHDLTSVHEQLAFFLLRPHLICLEREIYIGEEEILATFEEFFPEKREAIREIIDRRTAKFHEILAQMKVFAEQAIRISETGKEEKTEDEITLRAVALGCRKAEMAITKSKAGFPASSREELWKVLICALDRQNFILSEKTWKRIDAENDPEVLRAMVLVSLLNNDRTLPFRDMQRYVLEEEEALRKIVSLLRQGRELYSTSDDLEKAIEGLSTKKAE